MSQYLDIVREEVELTNEQIKRDMPRDQNKAANSLRVEVFGNEVRSVGMSYIEYLDKGSAPWKNPSEFKKLGFILDKSGWADRRDLNPYAAAYVIAHKGSQIYRGKKKGIELDEKLTDLKQRLSIKLAKFVQTEIKNKIRR